VHRLTSGRHTESLRFSGASNVEVTSSEAKPALSVSDDLRRQLNAQIAQRQLLVWSQLITNHKKFIFGGDPVSDEEYQEWPTS